MCGKPRKGVLHCSNKKFLELFLSSKNLHSGAKILFRHADRLSERRDGFCTNGKKMFAERGQMAVFVECAAKNDSKDEKNDCVSSCDSVPCY